MNNHERVGMALALLRDGLRPFVERECKSFYGDRWSVEMEKMLATTRLRSGGFNAIQDVAAQLVLMDRLWRELFSKSLGRAERSLVNELIDVRNRWAHQNPFTHEDADRALDTAVRLLTAVSAPEALEVRKLRGGQVRQPSVDTISTEPRTAEDAKETRALPRTGARLTHRARILDFLSQFPGRDDDEIAAALEIRPRQTVNMICRKLCEELVLRREPGRSGKILNFVIANAKPAVVHATHSPSVSESRVMSEDQVKSALEAILKADGWSVKVAWGRERGIDIEARRGQERWIIECKGEGSLAPMQNNYFVGVIGELMQRMSDGHAKHSIAFPDRPKFRRLWLELPATAKDRLRLTALFVSDAGRVVELST